MKVLSHIGYVALIAFVALCNAGYRYEIRQLELHVERLEDYIEENGLPTPAMPSDKESATFEIDVPVCEGDTCEQANPVLLSGDASAVLGSGQVPPLG